MISADTILGHFGYIYTRSCRCDGFFTKIYRKPGTAFTIRWRTGKMVFKVMHNSATYFTWQSIGKLENVLNELATQIIQTTKSKI